MCTLPVLKAVVRECYSPPEAVYDELKHKGMDLVTVSDHDSIDAVEALRRHADFFVSEEVTCHLPSGNELHIAVYDLTERHHVEIQRRRDDLPRLVAYLDAEQLFYSANHAFSALTGARSLEDYDWIDRVFPAVEAMNGHVPESCNLLARRLADHSGKVMLGGSDAHTLRSLGTASTRVRGARNKTEFMEGVRRGQASAEGESGNFWKLSRDILHICGSLFKEKPLMAILAPLALAVPAAALLNYWVEDGFARRWGSRWEQSQGMGASARRIGAASGEAAA
jgi:predicted metal-dependent phosphoesterase TrpH